MFNDASRVLRMVHPKLSLENLWHQAKSGTWLGNSPKQHHLSKQALANLLVYSNWTKVTFFGPQPHGFSVHMNRNVSRDMVEDGIVSKHLEGKETTIPRVLLHWRMRYINSPTNPLVPIRIHILHVKVIFVVVLAIHCNIMMCS
jgi:hypothetical protein